MLVYKIQYKIFSEEEKIMSFCPKCGRQLSDGEVCNCQAQNTQQVQPDAQTQSTQQLSLIHI